MLKDSISETLNRVKRSTDSATIIAFKTDHRPTRFAVNIAENPPTNIVDLFEKAYNAMDIKEMLKEKFKEFRTPTNPLNKIESYPTSLTQKKIKEKKYSNYKTFYHQSDL